METQGAPPSGALGQIVVVEEGCPAAEAAEAPVVVVVEEGEDVAVAVAVAVVRAEVRAEVEVDTRAMIEARRIKRGEGMRLARGALIGRRG